MGLDDFSLFEDEENILKRANDICDDESYKDNILYSDYVLLTKKYSKLLKETKKIIKISDNFERSLNITKMELEKANEIKTYLMNMAAHDLNNPISNIIGFSEYLKKSNGLNKKEQKILRLINETSQRMHDLIKKILEEAKINKGEIKLKLVRINLNKFIKKRLGYYQLKLEQKAQKLLFNPDVNEVFNIMADRVYLEEIIDNLLGNAMKFSGNDTVISIKTMQVELDSPVIRMEIHDQGPGFSTEDKEKIFQKFKKLSAEPTSGESSIGLGLYITRQLVEMQNATIGLRSEKGQGSCFFIDFPA